MRARIIAVWVGASIALLACSVQGAAAAKKRLTGKLSSPGYSVIALAASGKASSARAKPGFKLRAPAKTSTLHLRSTDGTYAGPVVVRRKRKGKRAIVGVRRGARLGKVQVKADEGYAKLKRRLPRKRTNGTRDARARQGVPIGAGAFGRVRVKRLGKGVPGDGDVDGVPDPLDVDDNGNLVLDTIDGGSSTARVLRRASGQQANDFHIGSVLDVSIDSTANANAGSTGAEIEAASPRWGWMSIEIMPGDTAELDCGGEGDPADPQGWIGGLVYCTRGGTGRAMALPGPPAFPECCDGDGDGFGTLVLSTEPPVTEMFLQHRATVDQIGTGDLLIQRVTSGGTESQFASTLPFAFATVPALVSYTDTAGNSAAVSYPVGGPANPANPEPGPGAEGNGLPVSAPPGEDVVLTLTFWRPQRSPIPGENGEWIDMGGLRHSANVRLAGGAGPGGEPDCPREAYSVASPPDPDLEPAAPSPFTTATGFKDLAPDRPASAANTFSYELNVTECLRGTAWNAGEQLEIAFQATNAPPVIAHTEQRIWFTRE